MSNVYINAVAKFLPNEAVPNDRIESVLGMVNGQPSRARAIVLRNNQIKSRYYAIGADGKASHTNAELTIESVKRVLANAGVDPADIDLLSCGTSTPDQLLPAHASMVHGLWKNKPLELNTNSGICTSGMNALKYAFMAVRTGSAKRAIATGSERVSSWLRADKFSREAEKLAELQQNPMIAFDKDFLRWMLSDGAAAALLSQEPNPTGLSLKVHWVEGVSYAHEIEPCMYAGATKENGILTSWSDIDPSTWLEQSVFAIKQDIRLLDTHIIAKGAESLRLILSRQGVPETDIDHFLPHISSFVFKDKLRVGFERAGIDIPEHKWFINLERFGNVGAASIYIQLEELFGSGKLAKGQKILLSVPESGRFSYVYSLLEVI